jgi:hypothetical protein
MVDNVTKGTRAHNTSPSIANKAAATDTVTNKAYAELALAREKEPAALRAAHVAALEAQCTAEVLAAASAGVVAISARLTNVPRKGIVRVHNPFGGAGDHGVEMHISSCELLMKYVPCACRKKLHTRLSLRDQPVCCSRRLCL